MTASDPAWIFDAPQAWTAVVDSAPRPDKSGNYYQQAVPALAHANLGPAPTPCVIVARVRDRPAACNLDPPALADEPRRSWMPCMTTARRHRITAA
jgi:hypothetical protein